MSGELCWVRCSDYPCTQIITLTLDQFTNAKGILECPKGHRCEYGVAEIKRGTPASE